MFSRPWLASLVAFACSSSGGRTGPASEQVAASPTTASLVEAAKPPPCADPVLAVDDGREVGFVCPDAIGERATILDLRDAWTPRLFAPSADGTAPAFRDNYLALASETDTSGKALNPNVGLTELYGIVPSLAVVRSRLAQHARHSCHAALESAPLAKLTRPYGEEHAGLVRHALHQKKILAKKADDPRYLAAVDIVDGVTAAQRHLVCEGFLAEKEVTGEFSWALGKALELFQRRHFLIPNSRLDPETRAALAADPRELDFRFALRVLRERVVDATGLIEDGTAGTGPLPILGRMIDPEPMRGPRGHGKPLANAAPDLVGPATETAARELGWTSPEAVEGFLARHPGGVRVAIELPPRPAYHAAHMELSAEIDRGDVWYDETPAQRVAWRRPALVLFVKDGDIKRPLIRWPTTIGGWSDVRIGGGIAKRWKESDVGPRQWRQLFAAPTWLPPSSTPDQELVKWNGPGKWELKKSIMGPGPMAAFGMVLLPHHAEVRGPDKRTKYVTNGIGTHGSAVVTSILNGTSHGCHRLYNQLAVRLGSFLLAHRTHAVKGQQPEHYRRTVRWMGTYPARIDTRGFLYELTPPVPVEVLPGTIRSERKVPPRASVAAGAQ